MNFFFRGAAILQLNVCRNIITVQPDDFWRVLQGKQLQLLFCVAAKLYLSPITSLASPLASPGT